LAGLHYNDERPDQNSTNRPGNFNSGELDSRLRDRDRTIEDLNLRLREFTGLFRKEQTTRELLSRQIANAGSTRQRRF
jgi:hypothetical protein